MTGLVGRLTAPLPSTPAGGAGPSPRRPARAGFKRDGLKDTLARRCGLPTNGTALGRSGSSVSRAGKVKSARLEMPGGAVAGGSMPEELNGSTVFDKGSEMPAFWV